MVLFEGDGGKHAVPAIQATVGSPEPRSPKPGWEHCEISWIPQQLPGPFPARCPYLREAHPKVRLGEPVASSKHEPSCLQADLVCT